MSQCIYFLVGLRAASIDSLPLRRGALAERGLSEIFAGIPLDNQPCFDITGKGPGDKPGCVLTYQDARGNTPTRWGYYPAEQTWQPVGDGSLLWVGFNPDEPPTPEELARPRLCRGYDLALGDGKSWTIPVIRRPDNSSHLPSAFTRNAAGQQVESVRSEYRAYFERFRDAAAWFYAGMPEGGLARDDAVDLAVAALGINYRFGWNEQNLLQLVGSDNYITILYAAVDMPSFELQKKTALTQTEPSSAVGLPADSLTTGPALETSNS